MVPRCSATAFGALPRASEANKGMEGIITAGLGRARPRRATLLALVEDRPHPRARAVVSIPPSQAPAPGRAMKIVATLLLCAATVAARLELASDTPTSISTKLEEQSFLHAELAIATRSMPTRRRGLRPKRC